MYGLLKNTAYQNEGKTNQKQKKIRYRSSGVDGESLTYNFKR